MAVRRQDFDDRPAYPPPPRRPPPWPQRNHQTLRVTPAMPAGVTIKLWDLTDMVRVIEDWEDQAVNWAIVLLDNRGKNENDSARHLARV